MTAAREENGEPRDTPPGGPRPPAWPDDAFLRYTRNLERAYEDARGRLTPPPRIRFELRRKAIHAFTAVLVIPVLLFAPLWLATALALLTMAIITFAYFVERRRMVIVNPMQEAIQDAMTEPIQEILKKTRRPGETYPWSPVLYLVSLLAIAYGTDYLAIPYAYAFAAYAVLGFGDSASALYGIAYGRHRLPWNVKKSFEGTFAGIIVGYIAAVLFASLDYAIRGEVLPVPLFGITAVGAVTGMLAESLPRVEDNLVIPLGAWGSMVLLAFAAGLL